MFTTQMLKSSLSSFYILNYSINFESSVVLLCISSQSRVHFRKHFLNHLDIKLGQLIDIVIINIFQEKFCMVWMARSEIQVHFNLQTYYN